MISQITGSTVGIRFVERSPIGHFIVYFFIFAIWFIVFLIYLKNHSPRNCIEGTVCYPKDKKLKAAGCGHRLSSPLFYPGRTDNIN